MARQRDSASRPSPFGLGLDGSSPLFGTIKTARFAGHFSLVEEVPLSQPALALGLGLDGFFRTIPSI